MGAAPELFISAIHLFIGRPEESGSHFRSHLLPLVPLVPLLLLAPLCGFKVSRRRNISFVPFSAAVSFETSGIKAARNVVGVVVVAVGCCLMLAGFQVLHLIAFASAFEHFLFSSTRLEI